LSVTGLTGKPPPEVPMQSPDLFFCRTTNTVSGGL
jgi:hypothetical protein